MEGLDDLIWNLRFGDLARKNIGYGDTGDDSAVDEVLGRGLATEKFNRLL